MYSAAYNNSEEGSRSQDDGPRKVDIVSDHIRGALERIDASKCVVLGFLKGTASERFTVLTYICILYWLCLVTVHKDL